MNVLLTAAGWQTKPMIIGTSRFHLEQIMGAALWSLGKQGNNSN